MYFVLPKRLQNSLKRLPPTPSFLLHHQQPPFTSKNSHHVVPLIPKRCPQNSSQTIPKTTPFCPKNSTSFISKTTPLYLQTSTETTMKMPQKRCKKRPIDATAIVDGRRRRRATTVDGVHRRRLPPPPPSSPATPSLLRNSTCIASTMPCVFQTLDEFLISGGALCTPHV